jgi:hypothetical protein
MAMMNIHRIKSVKVIDDGYTQTENCSYWLKKVIIEDLDGLKFELNLFANDGDAMNGLAESEES